MGAGFALKKAMITLPSPDLPRERLIAHGGDRISTVELLAIILGTGMRGRDVVTLARDIMQNVGGVTNLSRTAPSELVTIPGIGMARAARIIASFQLGRRALEEGMQPMQAVAGPGDVYERLRSRFAGLHQELFLTVALDARNVILDVVEVARGTLTHVEVHPREVFRPLIRQAAAAGIVVHNHPSGDPTPSQDDLMVTARLQAAGQILGIPILDHIIVGRGRYVSLATMRRR